MSAPQWAKRIHAPPPTIPGQLLSHSDQAASDKLISLKEHLGKLCGFDDDRFPGSQPVSFDFRHLDQLEKEDFWVCEKSDGVRVLVMILANESGQHVFLIDRKGDFYENDNVVFPHQDGPAYLHSNTILDGELVTDTDPRTGKHHLRLLAFDCLVLDGVNLMEKSMASRYGRLKAWVMEPYAQNMANLPELARMQPFQVILKPQDLAYGIAKVFAELLPRLQHGNDGLIFTSAEARYTAGTDHKILKWKPPSENSIDFLLRLKFPPKPIPTLPAKASKAKKLAAQQVGEEPDYSAKPYFLLMMNNGREPVSFFDTMEVGDDEWEEWKRSGVQYDDRIVEVVWNAREQNWKILRFRDDKFEGNYSSVVTAIIKSIQDGVEADELIARSNAIRDAWKVREQRRAEEERRREEERRKEYERRKAEEAERQNQRKVNAPSLPPPPNPTRPQSYQGTMSGTKPMGGIKR